MAIRVESAVRGYHVYMNDCHPDIGDRFEVNVEELNCHDRYAVAVMANNNIVGHVPREFSKIVYYFLRNNGIVTGVVTGSRKRSTTHNKGLEIPCTYEFLSGKKKMKTLVKELRKMNTIC